MLTYRPDVLQEDLEHWPFEGEASNYKILDGNPQASGRMDMSDAKSRLGIWACTQGAFECTELGDELQTVLSGRLRLGRGDGSVHEFGPGDAFFTRKGERVRWHILEDVVKVFYTHFP